jgi:DNA-binding GntR family transcriptional regulator
VVVKRKIPSKLPFRSQKQRIYAELRKEILTFTINPQELLVESVVANRFGVSKAPVREALAILQRDGLIVSLPRKGYLVTPVTFRDVLELFELRTILEGAAVEIAATKISERTLRYLEDLRPKAATTPDFLSYDSEFHTVIARESQNLRLAQLIEQTVDQTARTIAVTADFGEHATIVEAMRAGDAARARAAMITHIRKEQARTVNPMVRVFAPSPEGLQAR